MFSSIQYSYLIPDVLFDSKQSDENNLDVLLFYTIPTAQ